MNKFFRDIYKDADEDARRAMMKSFVRLLLIEYLMLHKCIILENGAGREGGFLWGHLIRKDELAK